jgi:hypothetical protein
MTATVLILGSARAEGPAVVRSKPGSEYLVTPVAPTRGAFIEGPDVIADDWLCHENPDVCGPIADFWFRGEFIAWTLRKSSLPPLLTTSSAASGGIINQPDTVILVEREQLAPDYYLGGRFAVGMWLDYEQHCGLEGTYFFLAERSEAYTASDAGGGSSVLARPYIDANTGNPAARQVPFAGFRNGVIDFWGAASLQGGEVNFIVNHGCGGYCGWRVDWLLGVRYFLLTDDLEIRESATDSRNGDVYIVEDLFAARTDFVGPQVGLAWESRAGRWICRARATVAMGVSHERTIIAGLTRTIPTTGRASDQVGGLLALSTNINKHSDDTFAVAPELRLSVGFRLCENATLTAGYTMFGLTSAVRAGEQIDTTINPDLVPVGGGAGTSTVARPAYTPVESSIWAHGVSVGLEVQY